MKRAENLIEIEALLENLMKSHKEGGFLRKKILFFCSLYQKLSISMIIEKLKIKKTNFALMTSQLEKDGAIIIKKSTMDKRCRLVEVTTKGKEELDEFIKQIDKAMGPTTKEVDDCISKICQYLNKIL